MTDFSKTLVRASTVYSIMTEPTTKSPMQKWLDALDSLAAAEEKYASFKNKECKSALETLERIERWQNQISELELRKDDIELSEGCKSFLAKLYAAEKYGKWSTFKDKGNKYTVKGLLAEEEAITLLSRIDKRLYVKNDVRITNDYVSGVPDIVVADNLLNPEKIIDIKCPYDIETFICNLGKDLGSIYWWQVQTYMWLTDAKSAEVVFCLMNTPEYILNTERRRLFDRMEVATEEDPKYKVALKTLENNLTFDDMPIRDRVIRIPVNRDDEAIAKIPPRVERCREYLAEIEELHLKTMEETPIPHIL